MRGQSSLSHVCTPLLDLWIRTPLLQWLTCLHAFRRGYGNIGLYLQWDQYILHTMSIIDKSSHPKNSSHVYATPTVKSMSPHTQKRCLAYTKPQLSLFLVSLKTSSKLQHFSCYKFPAMLIHEVAFAEVTHTPVELPPAQPPLLKTATVIFFFMWHFYSLDTKLKFLETGHLETCTCQLARCVGIGFCCLTVRTAASRQAAPFFISRGSSGKITEQYFSS